MIEYRIMEFQGKFYIQGKFTTVIYKSNFWCTSHKIESEKEEWLTVNEFGRRPIRITNLRFYYHQDSLPPFDTLEEATERVKLFLSERKFHYVTP